ncbi:MAG: arsenate reductase ArsC [Pseudobdellovibrionaceae bacterium]|nr:arsenate reductase ArsC [Pseudobdellovibrionaceae bacterium]
MKILFMCVANSARSQIAEGLARQLWADSVEIASAGSKPSRVNPHAEAVLKEIGAQTEVLHSKSVDDLPASFIDKLDFVITLCAEEVCPVIISKAKKLHWPLPDPAGHTGSDAEQLDRFRSTIAQLKPRLVEFGREYGILR